MLPPVLLSAFSSLLNFLDCTWARDECTKPLALILMKMQPHDEPIKKLNWSESACGQREHVDQIVLHLFAWPLDGAYNLFERADPIYDRLNGAHCKPMRIE